ncbi:MAG TPA: hypothetical protein VFT39_11805 [Vicinamibacterales bacterium]|nr:hypothetical protein [Vicinamibacterales bacterium]
MEPFHLAHLIALGVWLGVVMTAVLFEFAASDAESLRAAARFHYNVIEIATSLVAVGSALICVQWVFQRRRIKDVSMLLGFRRRIWTLAAVAAVFPLPLSISGWSISGDSCWPCHAS